MKKYHIRYNTKHGNSSLIWRVFENGQEYQVENFKILVPTWGESTLEADVEKWNVACEGNMRIENGIAIIY